MTYTCLKNVAAGVIVAGVLSGCSTNNCTGDPRTDGLLCAATQGQQYQELVHQKRTERLSIEAQADALRSRNTELLTELDQLNADERALNDALRETNDRLARMIDRLAELRTGMAGSRIELELAEDRLSALQARQTENSTNTEYDSALADEIAAVNNEISEIEETILALDG